MTDESRHRVPRQAARAARGLPAVCIAIACVWGGGCGATTGSDRRASDPPGSGQAVARGLPEAAPGPIAPVPASAPPGPEPYEDVPQAAPAGPVEPPVIRIGIDLEEEIDAIVRRAVQTHAAPGFVIAIGRSDGLVFHRAYGQRALVPRPEPMTVDTVFDLASVTKAVATTTSVMALIERGALSLDTPAVRYLPELRGERHRAITIEHLLTHTAGFPSVNALRDYEGEHEEVITRIAQTPLETPPGTQFSYSDISFLLLGEIVGRVSGHPLDEFARQTIFSPLGMADTGFNPPPDLISRIAPTERAERRGGVIIRGVVHDPRAWRLGGVAGNAGLFSTARDLSRFAQTLLAGGALEGRRVLEAATVEEMIRPRDVVGASRALGWDVARHGMSPRSFGHGGFTGTSVWVDPAHDAFFVVLSNSVHPTGGGSVRPVVQALTPLTIRAAEEAAPPTFSPIRTGIDVLERDGFAPLSGRRVVVLTHRAARTRDGRSTLGVLQAAPGVEVLRALAPEHGLGSNREGRIGNTRDPETGLRVMGLFGRHRVPTDAMLRGADTIVVDLQDVGVRFYTYASTVRHLLEAAKERGLAVMVLDRPDPLGGDAPRGPVSEPELASFVNHHPLPAVHGMTLGELATLLNEERGIGANLTVVELEGWRRTPWAQTGLRWVPSSPNLPSPRQVALYPALGLLEGTNVAVGRGTPTPFEVLGAPWIEPPALIEALGEVPGVRFEPTTFVPRSSRYRAERCHGVRVEVVDPEAYDPVRTGLALAVALRERFASDWEPERFERALGDRATFAAFMRGASIDEIEEMSRAPLDAFACLRERYLRYPSDANLRAR